MMGRRGEFIFRLSLTLIALAPAALFAYLGSFSRLMGDDYGYFASALRLGFRDSFGHWWNNWHGSYSFIVAFDALAPLGPENLPPVMPTVLISLFTLGQAWLIWHVLRDLQVDRDRLWIAVIVAALSAFATIISFHTRENYFHFIASLRHTAPVGAFLLFLGLALELARRIRSRPQSAWAAAACALIGFTIAGMSELHALLQLIALLILAGCFGAFIGRPLWRTRFVLISGGLLGSAASLLLQMSAPGAAMRVEQTATLEYTNPLGDLPTLIARTLESSYSYIGHPGSILGFMLLLAVGLAAALVACRPRSAPVVQSSMAFSAPALLAGLMLQLALFPALWLQAGAPTATLALSSTLVRGLHILMIAAFAIVILRRKTFEALLNRRADGALFASAAVLFAVLVMCAGAQDRELPAEAAAYLFVTALTLLGNLSLLLRSLNEDLPARWFARAASLSILMALAGVGLPVAVGLYSLGFVFDRTLAVSSWAQVTLGLVWGAYIGFLLGRACHPTQGHTRRARWMAAAGLLFAAAIIAVSVVLPQLRLAPNFAAYAREWDARHERIVKLRDRGEREIVVAPYSYDFTAYVSTRGLPMGQISSYYYDVDSIAVAEA